MVWWIYKCNGKYRSYQPRGGRIGGDWRSEFFEPNQIRQWGSTAHGKFGGQLAVLRRNHKIIAYQTDRNELVGLAKVVRLQPDGKQKRVLLKPLEEFEAGIKVRALKQRNKKIAAIDAFKKTGKIRTIYSITPAEAKRILAAIEIGRKRKEREFIEEEKRAEREFIEGEKRAAERTVRDPRLRTDAKNKWGLKCYCCGFDFEEFYGEMGKGVAIVHHLKLFKGEKRKATVQDVRIVCANCHSVLHIKNPPVSVDKLQKSVALSWFPWSGAGFSRRA